MVLVTYSAIGHKCKFTFLKSGLKYGFLFSILLRRKKIPKKNVDFLNVTPTGWTHRIPVKYANCTNANTDV